MGLKGKLFIVFALSAVLNIVGIGWGLPAPEVNWEQHSPAPDHVMGLLVDFTGYSYAAYSPAFPMILAAVSAPYLVYAHLTGDVHIDLAAHRYKYVNPAAVRTALILIARLVSFFMSLGVLYVVYRIAEELFDHRTAFLSCLILAVYYPFVFIAHNSTGDMAAMFAAVLCLYFLLRSLTKNRLSDYALAGVFAAFSVATKEYLYAAMLPVPLILLYDLWAQKKDRKLLRLSLLVLPAIFVFLYFTNLLFNPESYIQHLRHYASGASFPKPKIPFAQFGIVLEATVETGVRTFGYVLFFLCIAGVVFRAVKRIPYASNVLLLPMLSFFVFYLNVYNRVIVRYAFFLLALLPIFGADFFIRQILPRSKRVRIVSFAVLASALLVSLWQCVALDWDIVRDSRYDAERWMASNLRCTTRLEFMDLAVNLPRMDPCGGGLPKNYVPSEAANPEGLAERSPDAIILNSYMVNETFFMDERDSRGSRVKKDYLIRLFNGDLGYRPVAEFPPPFRFRKDRFYNINQSFNILMREDLVEDRMPLPPFIGPDSEQSVRPHTYSISPDGKSVRMESWYAENVPVPETLTVSAPPGISEPCLVRIGESVWSLGGVRRSESRSYSTDEILVLDRPDAQWWLAGRLPRPYHLLKCWAQSDRIFYSGGQTLKPKSVKLILRPKQASDDPNFFLHRP